MEHDAKSDGGNEFNVGAVRQSVKVAVLEMSATWVVRRALEFGYHAVTGGELPTARDRHVPFRQVLIWATVTAAAIAAADVIVDHSALRPKQPRNG